MLENKELVSSFFLVVGYLLLMNVGLIAGAVNSYFRRRKKEDKDLENAWAAIRGIRKDIESIKQLLTGNQQEDKTQGESS